MSYMESWGFLQRYRPYRCYLCPDGTGELADLSCGDPWYREILEDEPGHSLVVVRTERGKENPSLGPGGRLRALETGGAEGIGGFPDQSAEQAESGMGKACGHEMLWSPDPANGRIFAI